MSEAKELALLIMKKRKNGEVQSVPMPDQEEFLSSEADNSDMLHDNEDFLSSEDEDHPVKEEPNIPDTDKKPVIAGILDKMRLKKLKSASK